MRSCHAGTAEAVIGGVVKDVAAPKDPEPAPRGRAKPSFTEGGRRHHGGWVKRPSLQDLALQVFWGWLAACLFMSFLWIRIRSGVSLRAVQVDEGLLNKPSRSLVAANNC